MIGEAKNISCSVSSHSCLRSRRRTYNVARMTATPSVNRVRLDRKQREKKPLESRLKPVDGHEECDDDAIARNVNPVVIVAEMGITIRGNESLRRTEARRTNDSRANDVPSRKYVQITIPVSR